MRTRALIEAALSAATTALGPLGFVQLTDFGEGHAYSQRAGSLEYEVYVNLPSYRTAVGVQALLGIYHEAVTVAPAVAAAPAGRTGVPPAP
jgi:hypothetical protein